MSDKPERRREVVHYIADDKGGVQTLLKLIQDIREGRMKNFIVTAQVKRVPGDADEITIGDDRDGPMVRYYFFGEDPCTTCQGLAVRMIHLINQYMDGVDIFNEYEEGQDGT